MKRELLSKTNDKVFKEIFTRNKSCMADFLKCILNIPDEEFDDLEFLDTHTRKGSALDGEYILANFMRVNIVGVVLPSS